MRIRLLVAAIAAIVAASIVPAFADIGRTTQQTRVYQSNSAGSALVGTLPAGQNIEGQCQRDGWCRITGGGLSGWVQRNDVVLQSVSPPQPQPQPQPPRPQPQPQPQPNPGWPWPQPWPQPQPPRPQPPVFDEAGACFYSELNFRGSSFCVDEGDSYSRLNNWDNRIRSVEVFGGARVDLCSDERYRGYCVTLRSNASRLPTELDRRASSLDVY
ncbi:peptidase inhibitor family I36 protein [Devosia ginsengisoli]|uniref:peptidase inhibitor family I36 protein n=1 Tax=Devosia ginsengisoli TaxID=400770 RepID=UPI0026F19E56|nr:peptidase inhibitor family I36 protein [Devosia ginsengisoli]MCR6673927.1 peptidase inhibitor family I36 protein [Devosia ginsengisoli]